MVVSGTSSCKHEPVSLWDSFQPCFICLCFWSRLYCSGGELRSMALVCCCGIVSRWLRRKNVWDCTARSELQSLETAAGAATTPHVTITPCASVVDMRVPGKPFNFAGDEASWKRWDLRHVVFLCGCSGKGQDDGQRHEERELHSGPSRCVANVLARARAGEAKLRLQKVREGEGAEEWKAFSQHYEPEDRHEARRHDQADSLL